MTVENSETQSSEEIEVDLEQLIGNVFDTKLGAFMETLKGNSSNLSEDSMRKIVGDQFEGFKKLFTDGKTSAVPESSNDGLIAAISKVFDEKVANMPTNTGGKSPREPGPLGRILKG
jgi:hypothetical protein